MGKARTDRVIKRDTRRAKPLSRPTSGRPSDDPAAVKRAPDSDSSPPGADQVLSDADRTASAADQVSADADQRASDSDQASADRVQARTADIPPALERAFEASRASREAGSEQRQASGVDRTNTSRDREVTGRFRAVLDAGPNAVVGTDTAGIIVYANEHLESMFGYQVGTLVGQPIEDLIPEAAVARHVGKRERYAEHPADHDMSDGPERVGRRIDGTAFPVEVTLTPIETNDGLQVFATVVDISARKAQDSRRLHTQKLESIGRLAAGIAHDFNNMLFAIQGYATILADELGPAGRADLDADESLESVHAISLAAERAANLTAQLLAFSRNQVVNPVVLDLNVAITTIAALLRQMVGKPVRLQLRLQRSPSLIRADPGWIDQIVMNLVVNARDAMPRGGSVIIETGRLDCASTKVIADVEVPAGSYAFVSVTDTGSGIDSDSRAHIFEPYFTTKPIGKGTGLGLATTHGIVNQAGGHILVESEMGHGASFKLLFPRIEPNPRKRRVSAAPAT